jgi:hypothetical protein
LQSGYRKGSVQLPAIHPIVYARLQVYLGLFEPGTGILRSLAIVDHAGSNKSVPLIELPREAIKEIEADLGSRDVWIVDRGQSLHWQRSSAPISTFRTILLLS